MLPPGRGAHAVCYASLADTIQVGYKDNLQKALLVGLTTLAIQQLD
jgi:hypothetical protein